MFFFAETVSGMSSFSEEAGEVLTVFFAGDTFFVAGFVTVLVTGAVTVFLGTVVFFGAAVVFFDGDFFGAAFEVLLVLDVFFATVFFLGSAIEDNNKNNT
jgi:hypothetical protein